MSERFVGYPLGRYWIARRISLATCCGRRHLQIRIGSWLWGYQYGGWVRVPRQPVSLRLVRRCWCARYAPWRVLCRLGLHAWQTFHLAGRGRSGRQSVAYCRRCHDRRWRVDSQRLRLTFFPETGPLSLAEWHRMAASYLASSDMRDRALGVAMKSISGRGVERHALTH